ncbi:hypothetical protein I4Q36_01890 [Tuanshanicoccus lijuaniae]|uniref:hypothetical protein n=1 Tax=Aerococcaceae bacterium zg-1292 TaxID=2774330 RepID=UPI001935A72C|nr:hypothetical protein [Aerococcaceae bacterium zg-1292]MBF6978207.1 hypothetical protein [Aerococcaceae bacterium zg-BR22]MBS4456425.1 hypothetical protein [Aerococcaceae bacterium zg-A91]MBS4458275.1 hypothetical protein [Aerococcaceae bacterium zg-BR33]QQA37493.1 hypothetical protein I4Q36_01890 [Aerococcaceae bacterium zg-1292]
MYGYHEYRILIPQHLLVPYKHCQLIKFLQRAEGSIKYITAAHEVEGIIEHISDAVSLESMSRLYFYRVHFI